MLSAQKKVTTTTTTTWTLSQGRDEASHSLILLCGWLSLFKVYLSSFKVVLPPPPSRIRVWLTRHEVHDTKKGCTCSYSPILCMCYYKVACPENEKKVRSLRLPIFM